MNVYDFDKTIFYPNSMVKFGFFCMRRHPKIFFTYLCPMFSKAIKFKRKKISKNSLYGYMSSLIKHLKNPDKDIKDFWNKYEKNLSEWYLKQKKDDDLIITGSPEYLIKPITDKLGVNVVGTIVDRETGLMIGNIMMAKEKAKCIIEKDMPVIDNFYSDSLSDTPLALLADHAFIVTNKAKTVEPWPHIKDLVPKIKKKIKFD